MTNEELAEAFNDIYHAWQQRKAGCKLRRARIVPIEMFEDRYTILSMNAFITKWQKSERYKKALYKRETNNIRNRSKREGKDATEQEPSV